MEDIIEIWRDISGFEEKYQISNLGNVKSLNYNNTGRAGLLKPSQLANGYLQVALSKNNNRTMKLVHCLVAEAFIPNPNNLPKVNHIDEDKTNNYVDNLEWCSAQYNVNYGSRNERVATARRGIYGKNKTCKPVLCIETNMIYSGAYEAQQKTGISSGNIGQVCSSKRKTAGGYHWCYAEEVETNA